MLDMFWIEKHFDLLVNVLVQAFVEHSYNDKDDVDDDAEDSAKVSRVSADGIPDNFTQ